MRTHPVGLLTTSGDVPSEDLSIRQPFGAELVGTQLIDLSSLAPYPGALS